MKRIIAATAVAAALAAGNAQAGSTSGTFNVNVTLTSSCTLAAVTDNAVNLNYSLGLSAVGGTGNGLAQPFSVTGTMAGSQAGTCAVASCTNAAATNKTHTLIVNY